MVPEAIFKKFGVKLSSFVPFYKQVQDAFIDFDSRNRCMLKTIYVLFDSPFGLAAVMFFRKEEIEFGFAVPWGYEDNGALLTADHMRFPGINSSLRVDNPSNENLDRVLECLGRSYRHLRSLQDA